MPNSVQGLRRMGYKRGRQYDCYGALCFPETLSQLQKLKSVSIEFISEVSGGWRGSVPFSWDLSTAADLKIFRSRDFAEIPAVMSQVPHLAGLVFLDLSCNFLTELPDLGHLKRLRALHCYTNEFTVFPVESLTGLVEIEELNFNFCNLMEVPKSVVELSFLRNLRTLALTDFKESAEGVRGLSDLQDCIKLREPHPEVMGGGLMTVARFSHKFGQCGARIGAVRSRVYICC